MNYDVKQLFPTYSYIWNDLLMLYRSNNQF